MFLKIIHYFKIIFQSCASCVLCILQRKYSTHRSFVGSPLGQDALALEVKKRVQLSGRGDRSRVVG